MRVKWLFEARQAALNRNVRLSVERVWALLEFISEQQPLPGGFMVK